MTANLHTMPTVPKAVREQAQRALKIHKRTPVYGVGGVTVAEQLVAETQVDFETVRRMRRFFTVNEKGYRDSLQLQHTPQGSPLMRSWGLHGGDAGKTWAEASYASGRKLGEVEEDQWVTLLRLEPHTLYERLGFGAWKWEYGMSAKQAARFVEEYQRTHRLDFRFDRAFGDGGESVKNAMMRRIEGDNPFKSLARAVTQRHLQEAAHRDLVEHRESIGHPTLNWPEFVTYFVLAVHESAWIRDFGRQQTFPWRGRDLQPIMEYEDPVASFVTFFHPKGSCYHKNAPQGLLSSIDKLMREAAQGKLTDENYTRQVLHEARSWTAQHKHARGLGHTLLAAWERKEWDWFLEALPLDSPLRTPFTNFVTEDKLSKGL